MSCKSPVQSTVCPGPIVQQQFKDNSSHDLRCRGCKKQAGVLAKNALKGQAIHHQSELVDNPSNQALKRQALHDHSDLRDKPMPAGATYEKVRAAQSRVEAGVSTPLTHATR